MTGDGPCEPVPNGPRSHDKAAPKGSKYIRGYRIRRVAMVDVQLVVGIVSMVGLTAVAGVMSCFAFAGPTGEEPTTSDASAAD